MTVDFRNWRYCEADAINEFRAWEIIERRGLWPIPLDDPKSEVSEIANLGNGSFRYRVLCYVKESDFRYPTHLLVRTNSGELSYNVASLNGVSMAKFAKRIATGQDGEAATRPPTPAKPRAKSPRPSLLNEWRMSDGRLAWDVAQQNGISEQVLRWRITNKGMTPDDAATHPLVPNNAGMPRRNRIIPLGD